MIGAAITYARRGETQNITFNVLLLAMAAACVRGLPAVFYVTTRPWIRLDAALADGRAILCGWGETQNAPSCDGSGPCAHEPIQSPSSRGDAE